MSNAERLSPHFTLAELTHTQFRDFVNVPSAEQKERLRALCVGFLEPLRARFGPLYVSSGFRCPELNTLIGGSPTSAHPDGCAADVIPLREGVTVEAMVRWLRDESMLPFDQAIDEKGAGSGWLHLGMAQPHRKTPRRQCLRMRGGKYTPFPKE